jgi:hypothetical protein
MPEQIFIKLAVYLMAHEPISMAYFMNHSHQSVCLYVYPLVVARQRFGKNFSTATNIRNNRKIVGSVIFYAIRALPKESLWVCLCIPLSLLGNNSVNMFLASTKRCWRRRFLCGPWNNKGKYAISSSQNFLFLNKKSRLKKEVKIEQFYDLFSPIFFVEGWQNYRVV